MTISDWIRSRIKKHQPISSNIRPCRTLPLMFRGKLISAETVAVLYEHYNGAGVDHERLKSRADACCLAVGINPHTDSIERDFISDIVFNGVAPEEAIRQVNQIAANQILAKRGTASC